VNKQFLFFLVSGLCAANLFAAEPVTLRFATPHEPEHVVLTGAKKFKEIIDRESNGEIKVEILSFKDLAKVPAGHTTGSVSSNAVVAELKKGQFNVSQIYLSEFAQKYPVLSAVRIPFLIENHAHMNAIAESRVVEQLFAAVEPLGIKALGLGYSGGQEVYASTGKTPRKAEDFKGLKVRPTGGFDSFETDALKIFEATVVNDPATGATDLTKLPTEFPKHQFVYQRMVAGEEDLYGGILTDLFVDDKLQPELLSKIKAIVVPGMLYYTSLIVIDQKIFAKLSKSQQDLIVKAGRMAAKHERDHVIALEPKMLKKLRAAKVKVVEYNQNDRAAMAAKLKPMDEKYTKLLGNSIVGEIASLAPSKQKISSKK